MSSSDSLRWREKVAHGWLFTGLSPHATYMENPMLKEPYPRGHFCLSTSRAGMGEWPRGSLFRKDIDIGDSVELREQEQFALLQQLASYYADFIFPEEPTGQTRYYTKNKMFGPGSGFSLYAMLRHFKPRQVIEAGSGFTSALMLDVNDQYLGGDGPDLDRTQSEAAVIRSSGARIMPGVESSPCRCKKCPPQRSMHST